MTNADPLRGQAALRRPDPGSAPEAIEEQSFAIIEAEVGESRRIFGKSWPVARRLVHSAGDISLLADLYLPESAVEAGMAALRRGSPIFTDTEMARAGMPLRRFEPMGVSVSCFLSRPGLGEEAIRRGITRASAGMEALCDEFGGAIVAIGNAPTALLALVSLLDAGAPPPALVIGMPVGFVNAAESKELLLRRPHIPSLVVRGRRGGSPLAAATVNALAVMAAK